VPLPHLPQAEEVVGAGIKREEPDDVMGGQQQQEEEGGPPTKKIKTEDGSAVAAGMV
jgi:hypothetical protein